MQKTTGVPGIYQISVKDTPHSYIGSSTRCINSRFRQHKIQLKNNTHPNRFLRNCFTKYGSSSLVLNIVENLAEANREEILEREKFWIDKLKPDLNIIEDPTQFFINNSGENNGNAKVKNEEISIIKGLITQGLGHKTINETIDLSDYKDPAGLIKGLRYENDWSCVETDKKYEVIYELCSPEGVKFKTNNLYKFKKDNKCPWWVCKIYDLLSCKISTRDAGLYGWKCEVIHYPDIENIKQVKLLSCKINNLHLANLEKARIVIKNSKKEKNYLLFNYLGEFFVFNNIEKFCQENSLEEKLLQSTKNEKTKQHKGWILRDIDFDSEVRIDRYKISTPEDSIIYSPSGTLCLVSLDLGLSYRKLSYAYKKGSEVKGYTVIKETLLFKKEAESWVCNIL